MSRVERRFLVTQSNKAYSKDYESHIGSSLQAAFKDSTADRLEVEEYFTISDSVEVTVLKLTWDEPLQKAAEPKETGGFTEVRPPYRQYL